MRCMGCGIELQCNNKDDLGYTPSLDNKLCERCFKLRNYNVLTNMGVVIDNKRIIKKINRMDSFVIFLVDYLSICKEVIDTYNEIKWKKVLVITKSDLMPKNIIKDRFINKVKKVYNIREDVILISNKNKMNISVISNIIEKRKDVVVVGYSNAGKSSLINAIVGSDITVSRNINTTQDFISLKYDGLKIVDAPGFCSKICDLTVKREIKPKTYQLQDKYYLQVGNVKVSFNSDANVTVYVSDEVEVKRFKKKEKVDYNIAVFKNSDIVLKGIGVIKVSSATNAYLSSGDYEIRSSLYGGYHE